MSAESCKTGIEKIWQLAIPIPNRLYKNKITINTIEKNLYKFGINVVVIFSIKNE